MSIKEEIGARIKTMRLSRDMTQADLAKAIGQSASSITMYETGKREPDFETMEALADVFNVPLNYLMFDSNKHPDGLRPVSSIKYTSIPLISAVAAGLGRFSALPAVFTAPVILRLLQVVLGNVLLLVRVAFLGIYP